MSDKSISVSIEFLSSNDPRVVVTLRPRKAEMLIDGHQNITDTVFDEIRKGLEFVYNHIEASQQVTDKE